MGCEMTGLFQEPDDATPLTPQEREGLLQPWITHRRDLNEAEQDNIIECLAWVRRRRGLSAHKLLDDRFVRDLHKRMFGNVWNWAGTYRRTERNIGIEAYRIQPELAQMLGDVRYWLDHQTFQGDEIAVRLHHRMVAIHPFPNGNGRHARLMADLLMEQLGRQAFTWGGGSLHDIGELRAAYVSALRAADGHDISPLLAFARA